MADLLEGHIQSLGQEDIGRWVEYRNGPNREPGRIKSFDNEHSRVFVVFHADGKLHTDAFAQYTGQSVSYAQIALMVSDW
jgi:hypothetical protein